MQQTAWMYTRDIYQYDCVSVLCTIKTNNITRTGTVCDGIIGWSSFVVINVGVACHGTAQRGEVSSLWRRERLEFWMMDDNGRAQLSRHRSFHNLHRLCPVSLENERKREKNALGVLGRRGVFCWETHLVCRMGRTWKKEMLCHVFFF